MRFLACCLSLSLALATALPIREGVAQAQATIFVSRVEVTPLGRSLPLPQDVDGVVIGADGRIAVGVPLQVSAAGGFRAFTASGAAGTFRFSLTEGSFSVRVSDHDCQPAQITVDGTTRIWIEFREVATGLAPTATPPPPPPTATPLPSPSPPTPTPWPTATPPEAPPAETATPESAPTSPPVEAEPSPTEEPLAAPTDTPSPAEEPSPTEEPLTAPTDTPLPAATDTPPAPTDTPPPAPTATLPPSPTPTWSAALARPPQVVAVTPPATATAIVAPAAPTTIAAAPGLPLPGMGGWLDAFLSGVGVGAATAVVVFVVWLARRHRSQRRD